MSQKKQYKLLAGFHTDETNKEHSAGAIVDSAVDLVALFPGKFAIANSEEVTTAAKTPTAAPVPAPSKEEHKQAEIPAAAPVPAPAAPAPVQSKLGGDVTMQFPSAIAADLKVFINKKGQYTVADSAKVDRALHKAALTSVEEVNEWIADFTK